jgi:hypothetical protein
MNKEDFNFLVECAVKAPSGHNTQPWKFENSANEIIIHPDFKIMFVSFYFPYLRYNHMLLNELGFIAVRQYS